MEDNGGLAWHGIVGHHAGACHSVDGLRLLGNDTYVLDRSHVLEQEWLVALDELELLEGHAEEESRLFADLRCLFKDMGSELHSEAGLLFVSHGRAHRRDVLGALDCASLSPCLGTKDLEDLLLPLGELRADSNDAALLGSFRLSRSGTLLALLLATTLLRFLDGEADVALRGLKVLELISQKLVEGTTLGPAVEEEEVGGLCGHTGALLKHGQDERLPHMLAEVRSDRVHDREDGLNVASNDEGVLLAFTSNRVVLLDAKHMVEDNDDVAVLHPIVVFLGIGEGLVDLVHHQVIPESVLGNVILGEVQRLLRDVVLDP